MTGDDRRVPPHGGRAWAFADHLGAEEMLAVRHHGLSPDEAAVRLFADLDAELATRFAVGDVLVAGQHAGHGEGATSVAVALHAAGFRAVVAASFAPGFDDALVSASVPALVVDAPGIFRTGDRLRINYEAGTIANLSSGDRQPVRNLTDEMLARLRDLIGR